MHTRTWCYCKEYGTAIYPAWPNLGINMTTWSPRGPLICPHFIDIFINCRFDIWHADIGSRLIDHYAKYSKTCTSDHQPYTALKMCTVLGTSLGSINYSPVPKSTNLKQPTKLVVEKLLSFFLQTKYNLDTLDQLSSAQYRSLKPVCAVLYTLMGLQSTSVVLNEVALPTRARRICWMKRGMVVYLWIGASTSRTPPVCL